MNRENTKRRGARSKDTTSVAPPTAPPAPSAEERMDELAISDDFAHEKSILTAFLENLLVVAVAVMLLVLIAAFSPNSLMDFFDSFDVTWPWKVVNSTNG